MTRPRVRAAYAAAGWAGVFALISLYWAVGATIGIDWYPCYWHLAL